MGIILFNLRDLQRLERRIDKVQKEQAPPTLRMEVIQEQDDYDAIEGDNVMSERMADNVNKYDPWTMVIKVEKKPKDWGK
jgi:hypothetical protein